MVGRENQWASDDRRQTILVNDKKSTIDTNEQAFHTIAVSAQIYEFEITFWMSGDSDSQENAFDDVCSATQINADLHTFQTNNSFLFLFSVINFDSVLNNAHISLVVRLQFHPRHRLDFSFISDVAFLFSLWTRKSIRNAILVARLSYAFPSISNDDLSRSHFIRSRSSFCSFMDAHRTSCAVSVSLSLESISNECINFKRCSLMKFSRRPGVNISVSFHFSSSLKIESNRIRPHRKKIASWNIDFD